MRTPFSSSPRGRLNRRSFLYGLGGIGVGLPFLEGAQDRSAWAAGEQPVFVFFMGTSNGVVGDEFWPQGTGPLTDLASDPGAVGILSDFADRLLVIGGLAYPGHVASDTHGTSYPQMLTGAVPLSSSKPLLNAAGPSLDVILAPLLNADGAAPLTLYSGMKPGYINEGMSWAAAGELRAAEGNPFTVYTGLVGGLAEDPNLLTQAVLARRQSVIDLARDELLSFQARERISQSDRTRLEQHLSALRDIETGLGGLTDASCSTSLLDRAAIEAVKDTYKRDGMVEVVSQLQLDLAAFAFACGLNHVGTLQSGDGLDSTRYDVPNNARGWNFHHISHRIQSDATAGNDAMAEVAHAEIDRLRMETFAHGLRQFDAHGLLDKTLIMWANQFSDGPSGSFSNLPIILAGNPYQRLQTGNYIKFSGRKNGDLLTTIARLFGVEQTIGEATGVLEEILA